MDVFAINGSPKGEKSNTMLILQPFLEGLEEGGASVELVQVRDLDVRPCDGDYFCWTKKPGVCRYHDDMEDLLPRVSGADVLVLAAPLYVDGMPGPLKNVIDRTLPLSDHSTVEVEGRFRHPRRDGSAGAKLVLVSNCGFYELANFDPLLVHVRAMSANMGWEFAGALLRPHGGFLFAMEKMGIPVQDVFAAAREAGRALAGTGVMPEKELEKISRPLLPKEDYLRELNAQFERALGKS